MIPSLVWIQGSMKVQTKFKFRSSILTLALETISILRAVRYTPVWETKELAAMNQKVQRHPIAGKEEPLQW